MQTPNSPAPTSASQQPPTQDEAAPVTQEIEWNDALEELLCEEAEKCSGLSWLHMKSESFYADRNSLLQMPMIILSAVTGATSLGSSALFPGETQAASVVLGCISLFVTILGLVDTKYAFGKRAEAHRLGSVQYAQIHRTLKIEMNLPRKQRTPPKQLLRIIKDDLKRLMETIPRVPEHIITRYKYEIVPQSDGVSHPEITNGIHRVQAYLPPPPHTADATVGTPEPELLSSSSSPRHVAIRLSV